MVDAITIAIMVIIAITIANIAIATLFEYLIWFVQSDCHSEYSTMSLFLLPLFDLPFCPNTPPPSGDSYCDNYSLTYDIVFT